MTVRAACSEVGKIFERKFFSFPYHLHMSFVTIVVRGLGVKAAVPIRVVGWVAHSTGWTVRDRIPLGTRFSAPADRP